MEDTNDIILVDRKYFVGICNISNTCKFKELYSIFQDKVGDLRCLVSLGNGRAFLIFGQPEMAIKAVIEFKNYSIDGQSLKVFNFLDFWRYNPEKAIENTIQGIYEKPVLSTVKDSQTSPRLIGSKSHENKWRDVARYTILITNITSASFWKIICIKLSEIGDIRMIKVNDDNQNTDSEIIVQYKCPSNAVKTIKNFNKLIVEGRIIEVKFA